MPDYAKTISKEELAQLPPVLYEGEIEVIDRMEQLDEACNFLLGQKVVGIDTESRPSFKKGVVNRVALLQLSTPERCFLFRLCRIRFDKAIMKILESNSILKVGLSLQDDFRELSKLRRFVPRGYVDLQSVVGSYGIEERSLAKIAAIVLGRRVSKAQRLSNWEAVQLTPAQLRYAATDAWVCTEIYDRLKALK